MPHPLPPIHPQRLLATLALACGVWLGGCASLPDNVLRPVSTAFATPADTALGQLVLAQRAAAQAKSDSGFVLLESADQAFGSRVALIDAAQKTLDIQYYAIHADPSTEVLFDRLLVAAARGVRVRILLDDFNTAGKHAQVLKIAFEKNIAVRLFNPLPGGRDGTIWRVLGSLHDVPRIQRRMHNKIFVADNAIAITGGRNLGETYFGQSENTNFVDIDVLAAGRIVRDLSGSFDQYWNNPLAYPVQSLTTEAELARLKPPAEPAADAKPTAAGPLHAVAATPAAPAETRASPTAPPFSLQTLPLTWAPAVMLVDKPSKIAAEEADVEDAQDTLVDGLLQLIGQSRREVLIVSPYFVPGARMMAQFAALRARGVRIRVLTNSLASNDAPLAHVGYARYRKALLAQGIELFEMRSEQSGAISNFGSSASASSAGSSRASLHAKMVVMDGRLIVVGSMNLDLRSQLQNSEVALLMRSRKLAEAAIRLIEPTLQNGAYRVQLVDGQLVWTAPASLSLPDQTREPDASTGLQLMLKLIGPFAPEEML